MKKRTLMGLLLLMISGRELTAQATPEEPINLNQDLVLTAKQRQSLEVEALRGSADAASKLSLFYGFVTLNAEEEYRWTLIGAENGDPRAQYDLYKDFLDGYVGIDKVRAEFWVRKAAASDFEEAKKAVFHIDQENARAKGAVVSAGARDATRRLLAFVSSLGSRSDVTPEHIAQRMGVKLSPDRGGLTYESKDLGNGWTYGVRFIGPESAKAGFGFWFYNEDRALDPTPICALTMDQLRTYLNAHGFVERAPRSEMGTTDFANFAKGDLVLAVMPRDVMTTSTGAQCLIGIQTTDGR